MSSDRKTRSELIGQVLTSIKDEDLKAVLSQKMAPSLDELPEVSDDEFLGRVGSNRRLNAPFPGIGGQRTRQKIPASSPASTPQDIIPG